MTLPKIQAVIWDMGGVLLRTEDRGPRTALGARFGLSYEAMDQAVFGSPSARDATLGLISEQAHWEQVFAALQVAAEEKERFIRDFWGGDVLDEALVGFIRNLRPQICTGLLSNAWLDARQNVEKNYHFLDAFDVSVFSAEVKLAKPDPAIYRLTLDRMGVEPGNAIFVDDVFANVAAARDVGMRAVHFISADQAMNEIKQWLADGVVD